MVGLDEAAGEEGMGTSWVGFWLLSVVTLGSLVLPGRRLLEGPLVSMTGIVEVGLPFVVAVGLVALMYELWGRSGVLSPVRVGAWAVAGWFFFAVLALFILSHQLVGVGRVVNPWLVVNNTGLGGALVGGWWGGMMRCVARIGGVWSGCAGGWRS